MNDKFDELARGLARSVTRQQALRRLAAGLAAVRRSSIMKTKTWIVVSTMLAMVAGEITALAQADDGEIWVTSQGTDRLFILHGQQAQGGVETIALPPTTGPHITTFSPDGKYASVSGMGNGDLDIIRANDRQLITRLSLGTVLTHQAKPSPDSATLLVAQIASASLIKVAADEASECPSPALLILRSMFWFS